jgi:hypothetical protein
MESIESEMGGNLNTGVGRHENNIIEIHKVEKETL